MASFFATDFLGTAPSTSATGQNGSVIAQLVKIAINMHFCDFSMIAYFPPEVHLEQKYSCIETKQFLLCYGVDPCHPVNFFGGDHSLKS